MGSLVLREKEAVEVISIFGTDWPISHTAVQPSQRLLKQLHCRSHQATLHLKDNGMLEEDEELYVKMKTQ